MQKTCHQTDALGRTVIANFPIKNKCPNVFLIHLFCFVFIFSLFLATTEWHWGEYEIPSHDSIAFSFPIVPLAIKIKNDGLERDLQEYKE